MSVSQMILHTMFIVQEIFSGIGQGKTAFFSGLEIIIYPYILPFSSHSVRMINIVEMRRNVRLGARKPLETFTFLVCNYSYIKKCRQIKHVSQAQRMLLGEKECGKFLAGSC